MASYTKSAQQWATFARSWYLLDAKMQPPGKIAAITAIKLQGRHKPVYHALSDLGDHVVIINTRHIAFSGNKWEQKVYSSHTGYPGGFLQLTATQLHRRDPTAIVKLAIYGMLPKNLLRRTMMQRLHLFADDEIPEEIRKNLVEELKQPRKVPKRLDEYTQEEIDAFPRLWTPQILSAQLLTERTNGPNQGCVAMFKKPYLLTFRPHLWQASSEVVRSQPLKMPAIDAGEMSGDNASGTWPYSPENTQEPSDSGHESLQQYTE